MWVVGRLDDGRAPLLLFSFADAPWVGRSGFLLLDRCFPRFILTKRLVRSFAATLWLFARIDDRHAPCCRCGRERRRGSVDRVASAGDTTGSRWPIDLRGCQSRVASGLSPTPVFDRDVRGSLPLLVLTARSGSNPSRWLFFSASHPFFQRRSLSLPNVSIRVSAGAEMLSRSTCADEIRSHMGEFS